MFRPTVVRRRPLLRAAVVGGGAYAAGRARNRRADAEMAQNQRLSELEAQQAAAPQPQQATGGAAGMMDQLSQLAALHDQGALTDDEFAAAKAKLLGG